VVKRHSFILIRQKAALVRRALAEVCTVPVLLVNLEVALNGCRLIILMEDLQESVCNLARVLQDTGCDLWQIFGERSLKKEVSSIMCLLFNTESTLNTLPKSAISSIQNVIVNFSHTKHQNTEKPSI